MSKGLHTALILVLLSVFGCSSMQEYVAPPVPSLEDEVAAFKPTQPQRWTLSNGLTVLYLKDDELPIVSGKLFVRGGSLWATNFPTGAAGAMADQMRQGGAGSRSADALDLELEKLAATVSSSMSSEFGAVSFAGLSSDIDRIFPIFADVALRPRFEEDRLALWKGQSLESIRRRKEDPTTVTSIAFMQLLYGDTPYGRVVMERDVAAISRADFVALHARFVRPDDAILVVTGRVEQQQVAALVEKHLGAWSARGTQLSAPPPVEYQPKPGVYFITLPFAQASVQMGQLGVPRLTPDYPQIDLFNEIFGASGFGSRLMHRVRTELGLSYGIYGGISPGVVRGVNYIFLQTKSDSVFAAINESIGVLKTMQEAPPTSKELAEKMAAIQNSYVFNFDSPQDIAGRKARLELLKYPNDYDQSYLAKIEGVSPEGVVQVAQTRWDTSQFVIVVVGNENAFTNLSSAVQEQGSPLGSFELRKLGFKSAVIQ